MQHREEKYTVLVNKREEFCDCGIFSRFECFIESNFVHQREFAS